MKTVTMHHEAFFGDSLFGASEKQWGWIMALGIMFIVFGTVGIGMLLTLTIASILFFGILLLVGGAAQSIEAFTFHGWRNIVSHLLMGALYLFAAYVIITNPLAASAFLTFLLASAFMALGILRSITAVLHREYQQWGWMFFSGLLTVALGVMIITQWPVSGLWAIGLFVAIDMIFHGFAYIWLALAVKDAHAH